MNESIENIIGAGGGGFLAWMLIWVVRYVVIRRRVKNYIITTINLHLEEVFENTKWLKKFTVDVVQERQRIDGAPYYTKEQFHNLHKMNTDYIFYLTRREQAHVLGVFANMNEFETLFEGFCKTATELQEKRTQLSRKKADFMRQRSYRIQKLSCCFPKQISSIKELSPNYKAKIKAVELISKVSK
jgi:hypothetical protein